MKQENKQQGDEVLAARARVLEEARRFRATLATLLLTHAEQWVVFRDGRVVSAHATQEEAYVAGLEAFGPYGGHLVVRVREKEIVVLNDLTRLGH